MGEKSEVLTRRSLPLPFQMGTVSAKFIGRRGGYWIVGVAT